MNTSFNKITYKLIMSICMFLLVISFFSICYADNSNVNYYITFVKQNIGDFTVGQGREFAKLVFGKRIDGVDVNDTVYAGETLHAINPSIPAKDLYAIQFYYNGKPVCDLGEIPNNKAIYRINLF